MGKWFKRIVIAGAILLLLLIAAIIILPFALKGRIEPMVKEQVNANLNATVEWGDWDITVLKSFPDLTVQVENVKVCNKAPFEGICLADIGELVLTVDIWSLFGDRIDIKKVGLVRPVIHAKVLEDGTANWDITLPSEPTEVEEPADSTSGFHVALRDYWIEDGRVLYDDASLPMRMLLAGLDHKGSGDFTQDIFTLSTTTHADTADVVFDGVRYLKNATADIKADLDMDLPNMKFTFKENEATINRLALAFDGWVAMPKDDIDLDLKWDLKRNDLAALLSLVPAEFATDLNGVDMSGNVAFNGYVKGTYNDEQMPGFGVNIAVDNGRFKYPDLPKSVENILVKAAITSPQGKDLDGMVVDVPRFAMTLGGNPVDARLHLTTPISDPDIDTQVKARVDLGGLKDIVPMEKGDDLQGTFSADAKVKGRMSDIEAQHYDKFTAEGQVKLQGMIYRSDSLPYAIGITNMDLALSPRYLALGGFDGTVGGSDLHASGRFDNYLQWWLQDSTLTGTFTISSNKFDLNELMADNGGEGASSSQAADTSGLSVIEVPKHIDFKLNASAGQVLYDDLALTDLRGNVHVHDQRADLNGMSFGLFQGQVGLDGGYDTKDAAHPLVDLRYDIRDMDIESTVKYVETIQKVAPIAKTCKGRYSTTLTMRAKLDQHMDMDLNSLTGQGTLRTKSVRVDGFQPLVDIAKALKVQGIENTTLQDVNFSYEFRDGKMITKPFDVKIDRVKANVGGSTAFADQAIDYDMKAKVPTDIFGAQANQFVAGLLGQANQALGSNFQAPAEIDVQAKITGTIEKPIVKPVFGGGQGGGNLMQTVKEEVKQELNEQIDKAKEEAIARAREEAAKLMAEAEKQAQNIRDQARTSADQVKAQAYAAADKLVTDAKDPFAKAAAKLAADAAKKEADKQFQKAIDAADKQADNVLKGAQQQGDALIKKAEETNTTIK
ncbi:MAG: AsmA family protein [Flavobacteriales bacterium]|nr:AsmA family protein [Flavobacteriales bacterium]